MVPLEVTVITPAHMFGFGRSTKDPLAERKTVERWFASFPPNDPLGAHSAILTELGALSRAGCAAHTSTAGGGISPRRALRTVRRSLTTQYLEHGNRSTRVENQCWQALFDTTQGFLRLLPGFGREIGGHAQNNKWQALLPELLARQVTHQGIDAKIRLYRYEQWIPARWAELHRCSRPRARHRSSASRSATLADGVLTTIEQEYLRVLLLQLMNAGNLAPRHVQWVADQLAEWCCPLRLNWRRRL